MSGLFVLLAFLSLAALVVGLIKPGLVVRWGEGSKTRKQVLLYCGGAFFVSFILVGIFATNPLEERFTNQRSTVLASIQTELDSSRYNVVLDSADMYLDVAPKDSTLLSLKRAAEKGTLRTRLQAAPDSNHQLNKRLYGRLATLEPSNQQYQKKRDYYTQRVAEERERRRREEARAQSEAESKEYMERIQREIDSIEDFDVSNYTGSKDNILIGVAVFGAWATIIEESNDYVLSEEQKATLTDFKRKARNVQRRAFPRMRDAYGPAARKALWENDIEASTFGSGYRVIRFVGGVFAANRNIKEFQSGVSDILHKLRFDQSRYKWYEGDDEYTRYDLDSHDDGELVVWLENGRYRTVSSE